MSLLRDSYVDFTEREIDELIAYFLALKGRAGDENLRRRFDLMALQRNLKALGTFGFRPPRGAIPSISSILRTLGVTRGRVSRAVSAISRLRGLLAAHVEEFTQN